MNDFEVRLRLGDTDSGLQPANAKEKVKIPKCQGIAAIVWQVS
jgi:hypothetical protein